MKLRFARISLILFILTTFVKGQDTITFDDHGWNNDQVLSSSFSTGNYTFTSNKIFFTNYGYDFNVNQVSLYYVFQNSSTDAITISTNDNSLADFISLGAYQVSETSTQNLVIEGWNNTSKLYSKSFSNVNSWQLLNLNFSGINKLVIKLSSSSTNALVDYNFDNFSFNKTTIISDTTSPELISASVVNPTRVELIFSESIEKNSALNKLNYNIDNGITVDSVAISSDGKTVTLITSQNTANQIYTVVVKEIKDLAGNIISSLKNSAQYYYTGDSTPPELLSAAVLDSVTVELLFSEKIDSIAAQNKYNYKINNGISVLNAQLSLNQNKVTVHTTQHVSGLSYSIAVQNIIDLAGNLISDKNLAQYSYFVDITPPYVSDISVTNNKSITVKFSERLDPNSAANKNNYNISANIKINSVKLLPDSSEVLLNTSQEESGAEYTLTVTDIKDRAGNNISPNPESQNYQIPSKSGGSHGKNKFQSASSTSWYQNFSPDKCIDGEETTNPLSRWCSDKVLPDTIEFDLGSKYSIDSIRISFYQWESGGQYKYSVYASSDLNNWEPIVKKVWSENTEWTEIMFDAVESRYIKLVLFESNQSAPASIWEIETFGAEKISGLKSSNVTLNHYQLSQNYPNPFNPSTTIRYSIPSVETGYFPSVQLKVYDILGNEVATLVDENKPAGTYEVKFDAANLASGIYFYKLIADGYISTKKMVLLK